MALIFSPKLVEFLKEEEPLDQHHVSLGKANHGASLHGVLIGTHYAFRRLQMDRKIRVGIIGDYDPQKHFSHVPTNEALGHAARAISVSHDVTWVRTPSLTGRSVETLKQFDALWCASGSPYESMEGAIEGIRFAREMGRPFIAT